ncbi:MAG: DUF721 domain-containing protein [Pseudomonadota bacterium]
MRRVAGDAGFAEADVLLRWAEIVGEDLAGRCRPVKVSYGGRGSLGATLIVHADSGRAPEVEHSRRAILERVNQFYGYRAVARLKVTQSSVARGFAEGAAPFDGKPTSQEPTTAQRRKAADLTNDIQSPGLRAALTTMGAHVLAGTGARDTSTKSGD